MSFLSLQESTSRKAGAEAERQWWVSRLRQRIDELKPMAATTTNVGHWTQIEVETLEDIIRERTR